MEETGVVERARERVGGREGVNGNAGKVGVGWGNTVLARQGWWETWTGDMDGRHDPHDPL